MTDDVRQRNILIVNQHGDNRGDEAALDGMLRGLASQLGDVNFTVVHQFANPAAGPAFRQDVTWIPHRITILEAVRLVLYAVVRLTGVRAKFLLGRVGRDTINAYEQADVVISAPGGPYFGDMYINHEFVHWLYVWLARMHKKPCGLYATSAGPFKKKWANPFRRFTYRCFDVLYVRENISAGHIKELFGSCLINVNVSVDSALQVEVPPAERDHRRLIVVSAINWTYKGASDVLHRQRVYNASIVAAAQTLASDQSARVVFVPQLHGTRHRDTPYLSQLASDLQSKVDPERVQVEVWDENLDMMSQRTLFAAADFVIAGRYHPAVFALSAGVPQVCIPYEHKATGVLALANLSDVVIPIEEVTQESLVARAQYVLDNAESIRERSHRAAVSLRSLSSETSRAIAALVDRA
jgi:colanic acid/amylovoran biosynthesis protein